MGDDVKLKHEFVDYIPDNLVNGRLYVSIRFGTAAHLCACGCGEEVITPLGPSEWKMVYDGVSVSLKPSVGNWGFHCRSHYWIDRGEIRWARSFNDLKIEQVRKANRARRSRYFGRDRHSENIGVDATEGILVFRRLYRRAMKLLSSSGQRENDD